MTPLIQSRVKFGPFEADLTTRELWRNGVRLKCGGQPFEILIALADHPGQLVSRDELRKRIWSADTFVDFNHGLNAAVNKLREALCDSPEDPRYIETLPRRGYRIIAPLEKASGRVESLAVLPLENLSHDPAHACFADGLTEALITSLAHISGLRVTSRTTAMTYKGAHKSVPEIARELGVDGVVEGTVLRVDERVRVSAQLISTNDDALLWAESYERNARDILELQAELALAIAAEIQANLTRTRGR